MSRISSEGRAFRRAFVIVVVALAALSGVFLGLSYLQGPKLATAVVDVAGVVEQSGQQVRLFANQPIAPVTPDQVTVSPAATFSVSASGDVIAVQFEQRLDYATDYDVTIAGVRNPAGGQGATLEYSFTTASPTLYFLDRGEPDDVIYTTGIRGAERETAYRGRHIQDFVVMDDTLAVVSLTDERTSVIDVITISSGLTERLTLPQEGIVTDLDAADTGRLMGFTLTGSSTELYTIDLDANRVYRLATGLGGGPMHPLGWEFVPGTATLVALGVDGALLAIDPADGAVTPLGRYQDFDRVSPDGAVVTLTDAQGSVAVTIADGREQRVEITAEEGTAGFLRDVSVLADGTRVEKVVVPNSTGSAFVEQLRQVDGARVLQLFSTDGGTISDFEVSPNGQYVAVESVPNVASSVSDGYFADERSTSVTTIIVDLDTGAVVRSMQGFRLSW